MKSAPTRARVFIVLSMAALLGLPLGARPPQSGQKQPAPTFKVRVEYVEVDAIAHDKEGRFIPDLKKDDFEVYEDGKRQEIANMELVDVPMEPQPLPAMLAGRRFEPDVVSNTQRPGRVYLVVLDDLQINPIRTVAARKLARRFIETNVAPNDLAAVITTSGNRKSSQGFTSNRRLLFDAVDKCVGQKVMSPGMADVLAGAQTMGAKPDEAQRIFNARTTFDVLANVATFAGNIHSRRKAIVLIGEGVDYDLGGPSVISPPTTEPNTADSPDQAIAPVSSLAANGIPRRELRDRLNDFVAAANRGDVTLYALDPTIFTQGGDDFVDIASTVPGGGDQDAAGNETSKTGRLQNDVMAAQDNLRTLATETGGFAATGSLKAAQGAFDRIRSENSRYYILGYYPSNDKRDGKFRKIEVRVRRPGVQVAARKGYVAPKNDKDMPVPVQTAEGTSAPLREALLSALPTPGLPLSVTAAPFRSAQGDASVLLMMQIPPGAVKFVDTNGKIEGNLEVSFIAIDDQGKTRGGEHLELAMPLKPETAAAVQRAGLLVQSRVTLPPGRYVLRVGARDGNSERVGAVYCDIEVPDFAKLPLAMSGLVISSEQTALANPRPDKNLTTLLPGSPAVIRDFPQNDQIGVLAEVYDAKAATPHQIDIVTTIVGDDGREAYRHEDTRSTADLQGTQGGFGYLLKVPMASLAPGSYLLRVEARSHLDANNPVARETMIRVR